MPGRNTTDSDKISFRFSLLCFLLLSDSSPAVTLEWQRLFNKKRLFNHFVIGSRMEMGKFYNCLVIDTEIVVRNDTIFRCTATSATVPQEKCIEKSLGYCPFVNHKVYICKPYKKQTLKIVGKKYTDSFGKIDLIANRRDNYNYVIIDRIGGIGHHFIFDTSELIPKFPDFRKRKMRKPKG